LSTRVGNESKIHMRGARCWSQRSRSPAFSDQTLPTEKPATFVPRSIASTTPKARVMIDARTESEAARRSWCSGAAASIVRRTAASERPMVRRLNFEGIASAHLIRPATTATKWRGDEASVDSGLHPEWVQGRARRAWSEGDYVMTGRCMVL